MRRFLVALLAAVGPLVLFALPGAAQSTFTGPLGMTCQDFTSSDGVAYTKCTKKFSHTDDSNLGPHLDTDLTFLTSALKSGSKTLLDHPLPAIFMVHGWGGEKSTFESQTKTSTTPEFSQYNNVWFASKGYAAVNYTVRGHWGSCGPNDPDQFAADSGCGTGWAHLADRRYEIRDLQELAGLMVDGGVASNGHIAVTGLSYGGGHSWLAALQADKMTNTDGTTVDWVSAGGTRMARLAAAVPRYTWSDLLHSLIPNGRASDGIGLADGDRTSPLGIAKESFITALLGVEGVVGCPGPPFPGGCIRIAPPGVDPTADLITWDAAINAGEPYEANPNVPPAVAQITQWKSPYYQTSLITHDVASGNEVPILAIQGWTDELFPEAEAVSMINKLHASDKNWPIGLALGDLGHPIGQNKAPDWGPLNARANAFLDHYLLPGSSVVADLSTQARISTCDSSVGALYTARSFQQLAPHRLVLNSSTTQTSTSVADPSESSQTDPIYDYTVKGQGKTSPCIVLGPPNNASGNAYWNFPLKNAVTLLGAPVLRLDAAVSGVNAELNGKLWDVAPDGKRTLVTRGAYRFTGQSGAALIATQLQGNAWTFLACHTIQVEVTQQDALYLRPDNLPSQITYSSMSLTLPSVAGGNPVGGCVAGQQASSATSPNLPFTAGAEANHPLLPIGLLLGGILAVSTGFLLRNRSA